MKLKTINFLNGNFVLYCITEIWFSRLECFCKCVREGEMKGSSSKSSFKGKSLQFTISSKNLYWFSQYRIHCIKHNDFVYYLVVRPFDIVIDKQKQNLELIIIYYYNRSVGLAVRLVLFLYSTTVFSFIFLRKR